MKCVALFVALSLAPAALCQTIAIRAGNLIDPESGTIAKDQTIVVRNGRIASVGAGPAPEGAKVVDLGNAWVMPGMFDCHTHVAMRIHSQEHGRNALFEYDIASTSAKRALDAVANCREFLNAGITTVRDVGNSGRYIDTDVRRAVESGLIDGPTIINAGRIIAPFGGQYFVHPERPHLLEPEYFAADTRDEMTKAVRENIHYGAQVIKIVMDDQRYIYSAEDVRHIVEEAARAGIKVCAHTLTEQGARNAIEGGVASLEHGFSMSNEALALAKQKGVALVSTDLTPRVWKEYKLSDQVGERIYAGTIDRLARAYKAGVMLAFGSDLIFSISEMDRGQWALSQVEGYQKAGIPNAETLRALTINAARLCGIERERGAIKPGFAADIIAMPANPLEDISAVRNVSFVMKDGRVVKGQ